MAKTGVIIGIGLGVVAVAAFAGVAMAKSKTPAQSGQGTAPAGAAMFAQGQLPTNATGAADAITKVLGTPTVTQWTAPSGRTYTVMEWTKLGTAGSQNSITALLYTQTPSTLWSVQVISGQMPAQLLNVIPDATAQSDINNFVATQLMPLPIAPATAPAVPAFTLPTDPVQAAAVLTQTLGVPISVKQGTGASNRSYTITQWRSAIAPAGSALPQNTQVVMIFGALPFTLWAVQRNQDGTTMQLLNVVPDSPAQADIDKFVQSL